jgi:hypothetical protein
MLVGTNVWYVIVFETNVEQVYEKYVSWNVTVIVVNITGEVATVSTKVTVSI